MTKNKQISFDPEVGQAINIHFKKLSGFHNSFNEYIEYCEAQVEVGLIPSEWGIWWDRQCELIKEDKEA